MKILPLSAVPQLAEEVAVALHQEFGASNSLPFFRSIIEHSMTATGLPKTFVALIDNNFVGTVGIWNADLLARQDLSPWLSALYVKPEYRNKGIAFKLQETVLAFAKENHVPTLYLYTDLINFYEKRGWSYIGSSYEFNGNSTNLYQMNLD